jgi:hypothetical protein
MALPDVNRSVLAKHYEGDTSSFSNDFVQGRLDEAVDKIEARWGAVVSARLASGALKTRLYEAVVCRVATRVLRNPEGYRSEQEGGYQYNLSAAVASGTLWFTDDDARDLTGIGLNGGTVLGTASVSRLSPGFVS